MLPQRFEELLRSLAAPRPVPAGGVAGAAAAGLAAALVEMVAGMTLDRPRYQAVHDEMERIRAAAGTLRHRCVALMNEDVAAVAARTGMVDTQRELAACASALAGLARSAAERGHAAARGDAIMAACLAAAVARGAAFNVDLNTAGMADEATAGIRRAAWVDVVAADADVAALALLGGPSAPDSIEQGLAP